MEELRVHSIFESISGEAGGFPQGTWCSFIRLQGCNLRCEWCFGVIPGRRIPRIISSRGENIKLPEVKKGDLLMTFDPSGNIVETEVINTHQHQVDSWLRITIKGIQYFVTEEHPFFTTRGLIPANQLIIGDMILHSSGSQKISFQKKLMNPMKNPEVAAKSKEGTDYTKIGKAVSRAIQKKKEEGKKLKAMNGHKVEKIDYIERKNYPPSTRPAPLNVYNLTCAPYNSYLIDYMWVHNCDTTSSQDGREVSKLMTPQEIVDACKLNHVLITGGEPMIQARELVPVVVALLEKGCQVQIETNGSLKLPPLEFQALPSLRGTYWVVDYKCPSSGMAERMADLETLAAWIFLIKDCGGEACIKWVVKDNADLDFALLRIEELIYKHTILSLMDTKHLISPLDGCGNYIPAMVEQIKRLNGDILNHIIFSIQLHKIFDLP